MRYDDAAWLLACGGLTALGVVWAVLTYRRKGWSSALRVFGWALIPISLWLTGLSQLIWVAAVEVTRTAGNLVFSVKAWIGIALFFVSFVLLGGVGYVRRRRARGKGEGGEDAAGQPKAAKAKATKAKAPDAKPSKAVEKGKPDDGLDDLSDIEAILKKRGIE